MAIEVEHQEVVKKNVQVYAADTMTFGPTTDGKLAITFEIDGDHVGQVHTKEEALEIFRIFTENLRELGWLE